MQVSKKQLDEFIAKVNNEKKWLAEQLYASFEREPHPCSECPLRKRCWRRGCSKQEWCVESLMQAAEKESHKYTTPYVVSRRINGRV